jgi:hypothetical protein
VKGSIGPQLPYSKENSGSKAEERNDGKEVPLYSGENMSILRIEGSVP